MLSSRFKELFDLVEGMALDCHAELRQLTRMSTAPFLLTPLSPEMGVFASIRLILLLRMDCMRGSGPAGRCAWRSQLPDLY